MAHRLLPRVAVPPPEDMSNPRASAFFSGLQAASSSAAAAAQASSSSEQDTQSTDVTDYESYEYSTSGGTTISFGTATAILTGTAAVATDSNGSTITSVPATATGSSTLTSSTAGADHISDSSSHDPSSSAAVVHHSSHSGPSPGLIAAAVIIPLVVISAIAFALLLLRRRRRRRAVPQNQQHHQMTDQPKPSGGAFMKETAITSTGDSNAPILTNTTNNAYYTGLSTPTSPASTIRGPSGDSARTASGYYEPPPPAYVRNAPPGSTYTLPDLTFTSDPFMDPVSPVSPSNSDHTSPTGAALAALTGRDTAFTATSLSPQAGVARPNISRSGTVHSMTSVTSDTYSDTASVHSARPARRSGGAHVVRTSDYAPGYVIGMDPFEDPKEWKREA